MRTTLHDWRCFSQEYLYVKDHPRNPFCEQDFVDKFCLCVPYSAIPLSNSTVDALIQEILTLERIGDVVPALLLPLVPGSAA